MSATFDVLGVGLNATDTLLMVQEFPPYAGKVPFDREMNPTAGARIIASVEPCAIICGYGERPAWAPEGEITEWWEPGTRGGKADGGWQPPDEDLAAIFFTSGTTGNPKGCMIAHANLLSQVEKQHKN